MTTTLMIPLMPQCNNSDDNAILFMIKQWQRCFSSFGTTHMATDKDPRPFLNPTVSNNFSSGYLLLYHRKPSKMTQTQYDRYSISTPLHQYSSSFPESSLRSFTHSNFDKRKLTPTPRSKSINAITNTTIHQWQRHKLSLLTPTLTPKTVNANSTIHRCQS